MADVEDTGRGRGAEPKTRGAARPGPAVVGAGLWGVAAALVVWDLVGIGPWSPEGRPAGPGASTPDPFPYGTGGFPGTPVVGPLAARAENALGPAWACGTLALVVVLGVVAARALPLPVAWRTGLPAAPVAVCLLLLSLPVRDTLHLGQTGVLPVLLVVLGCCTVRAARPAGALVGLAAVLEPAALFCLPLLWCTGRRRAARYGGVTFVAGTALGWVLSPDAALTFWAHRVAGLGPGPAPAGLADLSLYGALLRLGCTGPLLAVLYAALAVAVAAVGLPRAVRLARDGQLLLAVAVTGCVAVAVVPATGRHQALWVLCTLAGRVGRRAVDRPAWPVVVVLVATLPARVLLPELSWLHPLRDNAALLTALAAACAVPFLPTTSPYFRSCTPTVYAPEDPGRRRRVPLLPPWRRALTRPNLVLELLLIRVFYAAYGAVRLAVDGGRSLAQRHGAQLHRAERALRIDVEHWANHTVVQIRWLRAFFDAYYESLHFAVPVVVLGVLYVRRPADFRRARLTLALGTAVALLGFWLFPLAPPRLMPGLGFVDTVHGVQDFSRPDYGVLTALTNQYAAMPSLHFGWALWCGVTTWTLATWWWLRAFGLLHPVITLCAIVVTGNHWVLDAVGGALVIGVGFGLTRLLTGPRVRDDGRPPDRSGTAPLPVGAPTTGGG